MPGLSTRATFNLRPLENTITYLGTFEDNIDQIAQATTRQIQPGFLDELGYYPPRQPQLPFVWSTDPAANDRARKWYFANKVKGGAGGRYQRTGAYGRSFRVRWQDGSLLVSTDYAGARWVGGSLSLDPQRAGRWQVPSHKRTGWPRQANTINFWFDAFREQLIANVTRDIGAVMAGRTRRRTFTSPARRR